MTEPHEMEESALPPARPGRPRPWTVEQGILTERGWREGYVAFKPTRWVYRRLFRELLEFNHAMERLERNALLLLGTFDTSFSTQVRAFFEQLADLRAFFRRLERKARVLAEGRGLKAVEPEAPPEALRPEEELQALVAPSVVEERLRPVPPERREPPEVEAPAAPQPQEEGLPDRRLAGLAWALAEDDQEPPAEGRGPREREEEEPPPPAGRRGRRKLE